MKKDIHVGDMNKLQSTDNNGQFVNMDKTESLENNRQFADINKRKSTENNEQFYNTNKSEPTENNGQFSDVDKTEPTENNGQFDNTNKTEPTENNGQFDNTNKTEPTENNGQFGNTNKTEPTENNGQFGNTNKTESTENNGQFSKTNKTESTQNNGQFGDTNKTEPTQNNGQFSKTNKTEPTENNGQFSKTNKTESTQNNGQFGDTNKTESTENNGQFGDTNKTEPTQNNGQFGNTNKTEPTENNGQFDNRNKTEPIENNGQFSKTNKTESTENNGQFGDTNKTEPTQNNVQFGNTSKTEPTQNNVQFGNTNKTEPTQNNGQFGNTNKTEPTENNGQFDNRNKTEPIENNGEFGDKDKTESETDGHFGYITKIESTHKNARFGDMEKSKSAEKDSKFWNKLLHTIWLCFSFFMLGFLVSQRGPAFLDLQKITHTDVDKASAFFTAGAVGYMTGSLISGFLYDRMCKSLLLFINIFLMGVFAAAIPFCSPYQLMVTVFLVATVFMGGLDAGGNAELIRTWGSANRPFMQALHFSFAFGSVVSPLVTAPFLIPLTANETESFGCNVSFTATTASSSSPSTSNDLLNTPTSITSLGDHRNPDPPTRVYIAFMIGAGAAVLACIPFLAMFCLEKRKQTVQKTRLETEVDNEENSKRLPRCVYFLTLFMLMVFYMMYSGAETTFSEYILTFVVKALCWDKTEGAHITSVFWAAFAVNRGFGIFILHFLTPVKVLSICCSSLIVSLTGFLFSGVYQFDTGIWVFTVMTGLSMSIIFPTGLTWAQEELLNITGKVASAILVSAMIAVMINPLILGYCMKAYTPMWFIYLLLGQSSVSFLIFIILLLFARTYLKRIRKETYAMSKYVK